MAGASEYREQQAVFKWAAQPTVRAKYPELKLLHHIKNETTGGAARVAIDRANGVKKGVPDLCLPVARGMYHGLYVEMKTARGRVSEAQRWWIRELAQQQYCVVVCHGWETAVATIQGYMDMEGQD